MRTTAKASPTADMGNPSNMRHAGMGNARNVRHASAANVRGCANSSAPAEVGHGASTEMWSPGASHRVRSAASKPAAASWRRGKGGTGQSGHQQDGGKQSGFRHGSLARSWFADTGGPLGNRITSAPDRSSSTMVR